VASKKQEATKLDSLWTLGAIQQPSQMLAEEAGKKMRSQVEFVAVECDTDGRVVWVERRAEWSNCKTGGDATQACGRRWLAAMMMILPVAGMASDSRACLACHALPSRHPAAWIFILN
jgi:hypothetical protein